MKVAQRVQILAPRDGMTLCMISTYVKVNERSRSGCYVPPGASAELPRLNSNTHVGSEANESKTGLKISGDFQRTD